MIKQGILNLSGQRAERVKCIIYPCNFSLSRNCTVMLPISTSSNPFPAFLHQLVVWKALPTGRLLLLPTIYFDQVYHVTVVFILHSMQYHYTHLTNVFLHCFKYTFNGSTHINDSKKEKKKEESHSSAFGFPHSILYRMRKKADVITANQTTTQATYAIQYGNGRWSFVKKSSPLNARLSSSFFMFPLTFLLSFSAVSLFLWFNSTFGLHFLNTIVTNIIGGVVNAIPIKDT